MATVEVPEICERVPLSASITHLPVYGQRLLELCDSAADSPERVYQIQLHAFPLSASFEGS